jgi:ActR/RegA family two-component response regulator/glycine cleavage system H lipoate-binding protein
MIYEANILVVDDDVTVCKSIANVLENEGFTVDKVYSGEEALDIVDKNNNKYALALVDLMLPGISGIQVLQEIKKKNPNITVVMITGYPSIKTAVESIKLSSFDYLPKPFTPDELCGLVARAMDRRRVYEEVAKHTGICEETLVKISIPNDIYCIPQHSWAKLESDGKVRIGMHHVFSKSIKHIISIQFPEKNETRYQGEVFLRIEGDQNQVLRLWTPVTGKIIQINRDLSRNFSKLFHDPYDQGWLAILEPLHFEEDIRNLVYLGKEKFHEK